MMSHAETMSEAGSVGPAQGVQGQAPSATGFRADIEGLRGVTLLAILLFHVDMPGVGGGFVGPDIFFIISGFVITGQLWKEVSSGGSIRLRRFYAGRARRLLPVSATVGIVTIIASVILLPPLEIRGVIGDGIACALYVGNYRFALQGVDYFAANRPPSPFQHYWTLGVEEQFYLIWPVLLAGTAWLVMRARRRRGAAAGASKRPYVVLLTVIAVGSFALSLVDTSAMPSMAYFSLQTRAWDLAVGALIAFTATQWSRLPARAATLTSWAGLALIVLACNQFKTSTPYPGTAALVPMLGTVLVIGAGCAGSLRGCGRILAWSPMRAMGRLSYSWYLWHWPVLVLAPALLGYPLGLAGRLVAVVFSGALAWLTLRLIENPLRYAARLRRSPAASIAVGALATALAACVGVAALVLVPAPVGRSLATQTLTIDEGAPLVGATAEQYNAVVQRMFAQVQSAVAASADLDDVPSDLDPPLADTAAEYDRLWFDGCLRNYLEVGQPECAMGDTNSPTTVALIGDSNAAMWTPGFQQAATQRHWRLELLAKSGCPVMNLSRINSAIGRNYTECDQWRAEITARLQTEHPKLVVLSMWRGYGRDEQDRFRSYDSAWLNSLTRLIQQLRGIGAQVLVLGPIPDMQQAVPTCLSVHLEDATACSPLTSEAVNDTGIAAETAATKAGGGQYADLTPLFCTTDRCPAIIGNSLLYFDRNHVTLEYSRLLAPVLGALTDRVLASN
jgi:peptidoglycan/LPS O-acetylase OafA/YrhL